jgi:cytosine/adenosine deaminase-related metal-dependent hydrolase
LEVASDIDAPEGTDVIDGAGMVAMPGFVNAHIHSWQTALRSVAADWTIAQYLRVMRARLAGHFGPDSIRIANYFGALNQIASGTTTLADWCHNNPTPDHTDAAIDGLMRSGSRAVFLHGSPKPDPKPGQKHFCEIPIPASEVKRVRTERLSSDDALVTMGLAILGPQLSVWDACDSDFRLARDLDLVASMHVSGKMLTEDGFERLSTTGLLGPHINVVHGNILGDDRLAMLVDQGVSFSLTLEVELQMGHCDPLTSRLRRLGGRISPGSDVESAMTGDNDLTAGTATSGTTVESFTSTENVTGGSGADLVIGNAAMESFFSSLKTERTARKTYRSRDEAKADVFDYIERFHNSKCRHSTIGYLSPMEFEMQARLA